MESTNDLTGKLPEEPNDNNQNGIEANGLANGNEIVSGITENLPENAEQLVTASLESPEGQDNETSPVQEANTLEAGTDEPLASPVIEAIADEQPALSSAEAVVEEPLASAISEAAVPETALVEDSEKEAPQAQAEEKNEEAAPKQQPKSKASKEPENDQETEEDLMVVEEEYATLSKDELIIKLEDLTKEEDITKVKSKIAIIKVLYNKILRQEKETALNAFMEAGGKREEFEAPEEPTFERYKTAFSVYSNRKKEIDKQAEQQRLDNLEKKKEILEAIKNLINKPETLKKTYEDFNELQRQWREIGQVPSAYTHDLWQNYHFYVEKFFDYVKINKELKDLDLRKNLEAKIALCEKTEELLLETSVNKSFQLLQQFHNEWKEIGPVPEDQNNDIWERFKGATEKLNKRRHDYYEALHVKQEENLAAKKLLCEKIEQLLSAEPQTGNDFEDKHKEITALQEEWRTIGFAPKKENAEIWKRFKSSVDAFYLKRKDFYKQIRNDRSENLNKKIALCVQAEALVSSTDWKRTTNEFIKLQQEWAKVGSIPKMHSDKIWKRFRAACDSFFNAKNEYFSSIDKVQLENLEKKKALIEKVENMEMGDNKEANLAELKEVQRMWIDVGHVPFKDKEPLQQAFRKAVDKQYDKLNISTVQKTAMKYKHKIERIKESGDGNRAISKERFALQNQITELRNEIAIWENNIGFFSNSPKSNLLKEEFQVKIDKAKDRIDELEAKMKVLKDS